MNRSRGTRTRRIAAGVLLATISIWGCARRTPESDGSGDPATGPAAGVDGSRLGAPDAEPQNWGAMGNRILPDLKYSIAEISGQFEEIVIGGSMASIGMPSFADLIDAEDAGLIRSYVIARAHEEREIQRKPVE